MKRLLLILLALCACLLGAAPLSPPALGATLTGFRGDAEGAVLDATGHIDSATTLSRLAALHANTYDYLIENGTQWGDLPGFLSAADAAGIKVFAYLIPPTECSPADCSELVPDGSDYVKWGTDIGALAAQHPSLAAWTVDDMDYNLALFTPGYVQQMTAAATAQAPQLKFYLQLYQPKITQSLLAGYTTAAGVIMPYRDGADSDTVWTDTLQSEIDSVTAMLPAGKQLIVMLYGNTLGGTRITPDADYVRAATTTAITNVQSGKIAGVILWKLMLDPTGQPANLSEDPAYHAVTHSGIGTLDFSVRDHTATQAGDYAQAATTVTLDPGSTSCQLAIYRIDDRSGTDPAGYHDREVYVGGSLVWGEDVTGDGTAWYSSNVLDVTSLLKNGSAPLSLRLRELKGVSNYEVRADFDDLRLTGCSIPTPGFESDSGWTLTHSADGTVTGSVHQDSPTFTTDSFAAVAPLFAS